MSITIEREYNRFRIKLTGDRTRYPAASTKEAAIAVEHYYGDQHNHSKCPLCRKMQQEGR